MNMQSEYITIPRKEYDRLLRAEVMLAAILRAKTYNRDSVVEAIKCTINALEAQRYAEEAAKSE